MKILFNKYEGTGNDFIIINNSGGEISLSDHNLIRYLCDRRFGIGADGLILVDEHEGYDFRMNYFNSDGYPASMCGNGGRCAAHFAMSHVAGFRELRFLAADGPHTASPEGDNIISLSINDVQDIRTTPDGMVINTGVPHLVVFTDDVETPDIVPMARLLRYSPAYAPEGVNVNFVKAEDNHLTVRTYERGVEDETLSCGTGVTASAIAAAKTGKIVTDNPSITVKGGTLSVKFRMRNGHVSDIFLTGPATFVYKGEIEI